MGNKIAIIGYGELGRQFHDFLSTGNSNAFLYFDDKLFGTNKDSEVFPFKSYLTGAFENEEFYVALGYHHLKEKLNIIDQLISLNRKLPFFKHPSGFIDRSATVGYGSFIYPMCTIDRNVEIGNGVLLNNSVCISHDSRIGNGSYISPGVIVSGNVEIGERTFIGSGAVISNNIKIGSDATIGIGSVVTKDVPNGYSTLGNPAKIFEQKLKLI